MSEIFSRSERLLGQENMEKIKNARVIVFGLGGVGSYAVEALARSGVGHIALVDGDKIAQSNINRQLFALHSTLGEYKTSVAEKRIKDINPDCTVERYDIFYLPECEREIPLEKYDYIIDAIDTVAAKIHLAKEAQRLNIGIISCMGTGKKLFPEKLKICDIYKTDTCPLAKVMRKELKAAGIKRLKVVYSPEKPKNDGERAPSSAPYVPPVAGIYLATEVIRDVCGICEE